MDSKIIVYGFCVLTIIGGSLFWRYAMEIDDAQEEVILAREHCLRLEEAIKQTEAWMVARKEAAALMKVVSLLDEANEPLRAELRSIQQKRMDVAKFFVSSIERAREETSGMLLPELTLATGSTFKQVKILSVDSEVATLHHTGGVSKVSTTILPSRLLDRLRFGYNPGGLGVGPPVVEKMPSLIAGASGTTVVNTAASDALVRLGMNFPSDTQEAKNKKIQARPRDPNRIKVEGDPSLWKSVERTSVGRAYIPGQGWLRIGADGPIPGSASGGIKK
jgi:hypothetical protein